MSNLLTFICVGLIIAAVSIAAHFSQSPAIDAVLNGDAHLECHMTDGVRIIDPDMIKYFHEGTWVFTNGHSKSCRIIPLHQD